MCTLLNDQRPATTKRSTRPIRWLTRDDSFVHRALPLAPFVLSISMPQRSQTKQRQSVWMEHFANEREERKKLKTEIKLNVFQWFISAELLFIKHFARQESCYDDVWPIFVDQLSAIAFGALASKARQLCVRRNLIQNDCLKLAVRSSNLRNHSKALSRRRRRAFVFKFALYPFDLQFSRLLLFHSHWVSALNLFGSRF